MTDEVDPWIYIKETVKIVAKAIIIIAFIIGLTLIGLEAIDTNECRHLDSDGLILDGRVEMKTYGRD